MHSKYLIHRDLKPSSILIDSDGKALITNLGNLRQLAKVKKRETRGEEGRGGKRGGGRHLQTVKQLLSLAPPATSHL
eukprot:291547-Hanusia_phi.AAC.1